jgi:protein disulfide-isomerase A6
LLALSTFNTCSALYSSKSNVVKLTKDNFKKLVLDSDELWFVEFYAPWCGHCKQLAPAWDKAADQLKGVVRLGAVDMTTDETVGQPYGIQGFPTIKFFGFNKQKPVNYESARDAETIVNYALDKVGSEVRKRTKSGGSTGGSNKGSESG